MLHASGEVRIITYGGGITVTIRFLRCEAAAELAVMIVLRRTVRYTDSSLDSISLSGLVANACVLYTFYSL